MGRKYKVTEIPQGKEKDYLNLKGVSPDEFDIVKSQLGFRQFRRFLRGKPTSQGNKSEIIEFEDNNGISKKIMTIAPTNDNGEYIPEMTVLFSSIPVK